MSHGEIKRHVLGAVVGKDETPVSSSAQIPVPAFGLLLMSWRYRCDCMCDAPSRHNVLTGKKVTSGAADPCKLCDLSNSILPASNQSSIFRKETKSLQLFLVCFVLGASNIISLKFTEII